MAGTRSRPPLSPEREQEIIQIVVEGLEKKQSFKDWKFALEELEDAKALSADRIKQLLNALTSLTQGEDDEDRQDLKRKTITIRSWIKARWWRRLFLAMVPSEVVDGGAVVRFSLWLLGNSASLTESGAYGICLRWLNCVLHHGLCSSLNPLINIYELFFQALLNEHEIPIMCDILYKLTGVDKKLVTCWRVRTLLHISEIVGDLDGLDDLLGKYQQLDPAISPISWSRRRTLRSSSLRNTIFERSFEYVHALRNPSKQDFDFLISCVSRQLGEMDNNAYGKIQIHLKEHRNKESGCSSRNLLPPIENIDFSEKAISLKPPVSSTRSILSLKATENDVAEDESRELLKRKRRRVELTGCRTLSDIFANIHLLAPPCQTLSLLSSPDLFCVIILNSNSTEVQERLSLTLYHLLHNEFLAISCSTGSTERKRDLLQRIIYLHEWLQDSLPVVGRFLAEYLSSKFWNGQDFFLEVLKLLSYLPITSISELDDCFLTPLRDFYDQKYSSIERVLVLTYLHRLILHWSMVELNRSLAESNGSLDDSSYLGSQRSQRLRTEQWRKKDKELMSSKLLALKPSVQEDNLFKSISDLTVEFGNFVARAMVRFSYFGETTNCNSSETKEDLNLFVTEVISMYCTLCQCMVDHNLPIFPRVPNSVIYLGLFSDNLFFLNKLLEYLIAAKQEILPICKMGAEKFDRSGDFASTLVALEQVSSVEFLNPVTVDILVVLCGQNLYLTRGESIMKKHWDIDDESITKEFGLNSHPALLPYAASHQNFASRRGLKALESPLNLQGGTEPAEYAQHLRSQVPLVFRFIDVFNRSNGEGSHLIDGMLRVDGSQIGSAVATSESTSGISSMKPASRNAVDL